MITDLTRRCELKLEAAPSRFGQVRRIVQAQLRYWRLDPLVDPAVLGLTELLANVHKHARPDKKCTVGMAYLPGRLIVSVHDTDPRLPEAGATETLSTGGRGLDIVAALSGEWGAGPDEGGGKTVWFTLRDEQRAARPAPVSSRPPASAPGPSARQPPPSGSPAPAPLDSAPFGPGAPEPGSPLPGAPEREEEPVPAPPLRTAVAH